MLLYCYYIVIILLLYCYLPYTLCFFIESYIDGKIFIESYTNGKSNDFIRRNPQETIIRTSTNKVRK